jgi:hypothetical protein
MFAGDSAPGMSQQFSNRRVAIFEVGRDTRERSPKIVRSCTSLPSAQPSGVENLSEALLEIAWCFGSTIRKYESLVSSREGSKQRQGWRANRADALSCFAFLESEARPDMVDFRPLQGRSLLSAKPRECDKAQRSRRGRGSRLSISNGSTKGRQFVRIENPVTSVAAAALDAFDRTLARRDKATPSRPAPYSA